MIGITAATPLSLIHPAPILQKQLLLIIRSPISMGQVFRIAIARLTSIQLSHNIKPPFKPEAIRTSFLHGTGFVNFICTSFKTYRYQVILPAADLTAGGMNASRPVHAMRMTLLQPGSVVGFFKIRLKNTTQTIAGSQPDETGLEEVYHKSTNFSGSDIVLPFYQSFSWNGQNLLVDISFTTANASDVPAFAFLILLPIKQLYSLFQARKKIIYISAEQVVSICNIHPLRIYMMKSQFLSGHMATLPFFLPTHRYLMLLMQVAIVRLMCIFLE